MSLTNGVVQQDNLPQLTQLVRSDTLPSALSNPYAGSGALAALVAGKPAYGIKWSVQSSPSGAGRANRATVIFQEPWLSMAAHFVFADATDFIGDSVLTGAAEGFWLFPMGQPTSIDYDILAGWTVNFAWLIAP